jgi:hypothetical protein
LRRIDLRETHRIASSRDLGLDAARELEIFKSFDAFAARYTACGRSEVWHVPSAALPTLDARLARRGIATSAVGEVVVAVRAASIASRPFSGAPPRTTIPEVLSCAPIEAVESAYAKRYITFNPEEGTLTLDGSVMMRRKLKRLSVRDEETGAIWKDAETGALVVDADDARGAELEAKTTRKVARRVHDWCSAGDIDLRAEIWVGLMCMARWSSQILSEAVPPRARIATMPQAADSKPDGTKRIVVCANAPSHAVTQNWLFTSSRPSMPPMLKSPHTWRIGRDAKARIEKGAATPSTKPWYGAHAYDLVSLEEPLDVVAYMVTHETCDIDLWRCLEASALFLVVCGPSPAALEAVHRAFPCTAPEPAKTG